MCCTASLNAVEKNGLKISWAKTEFRLTNEVGENGSDRNLGVNKIERFKYSEPSKGTDESWWI